MPNAGTAAITPRRCGEKRERRPGAAAAREQEAGGRGEENKGMEGRVDKRRRLHTEGICTSSGTATLGSIAQAHRGLG